MARLTVPCSVRPITRWPAAVEHAARLAALAVLASVPLGCAGHSSRTDDIADPNAALRDPEAAAKGTALNIGEQEALMRRIWNEHPATKASATGPAPSSSDLAARREAIKSLVWQARTGAPARIVGLQLLADDPSDIGNADTRSMLALLLPVEADYAVVRAASNLAAERGWADLSPALVRGLARTRGVTPDIDRPEYQALLKLNPGQRIEQIAFAQFAREAAPGLNARQIDRLERERSAAWDVLARVDPDGSKRAAMLSDPAHTVAGQGGAAAELQDAAIALGAVPVTGEQLAWLRRMRRESTWWAEATAAVAQISPEARRGWALRHAEPARWAAKHQPQWLALSRDQLASILADRLRSRKNYVRQPEGIDAAPGKENFLDHRAALVWGDVLATLVVDDALSSPAVAAALQAQSIRDRADTSTEFGGLLLVDDSAWSAKLYPPRGAQRLGDMRFVASDDMINSATTALAHYHFHAQAERNARYAGPSPGDAEYAARHGVTCLILTPIRAGILNADVLLPTGQTIDLGEIEAPAAASSR
jgi:hypothetical protein